MDREQALRIQRRAMADFVRMLGGSAPSSRTHELGAVIAALVPATPQRSIANSVAYSEPAELGWALPELAAAYAEAGVAAWTVWAPAFEGLAIAALEAAGHKLDGKPAAMVAELDAVQPLDPGDLEWDAAGEMPELGRLNDSAYGLAEDGMGALFARLPAGLEMRLYRARVDGDTACALATIDHDPVAGATGPDCGIYFVATPEAHRRRGLAGRLLSVALTEARERGCATTSLQASAMGRPLYARLGYVEYFHWNMYERRRP